MFARTIFAVALFSSAVLGTAPHIRSHRNDYVRIGLPLSGSHDPTGAYELLADTDGASNGVTVKGKVVKFSREMTVRLTAAVKLQGTRAIERLFETVSNPEAEGYGKVLPMEMVDRIAAPADESVEAVVRFIKESGGNVVDTTVSKGFIVFEAKVSAVESMFQCKLGLYRHKEHDFTMIRAVRGDYGIPSFLEEHLDFIGGLSVFPHLNGYKPMTEVELKSKNSPSDAALTVDPNFLRSHYKISPLEGDDAKHGIRQSVVGLIGQYFSESDLEKFNLLYMRSNLGHGIKKVIGPNDGSNPGVEANLDTQYVTGVAPKVETWFWSIGANVNDPFLEWIMEISNTTNAPQVHSASYGGAESALPESYAIRVDTEFQKMGVRGITILFASGDNAVGCTPDKTKFSPDWPASSAYATAVGASSMSLPLESGSEVVAPFTGSGFSNRYPRPSYQAAAVDAYLKSPDAKLPPSNFWNSTGRAYPDVSILGMNYAIFYKGEPHAGVGGTSCSAPVLAGIISLLNTKRAEAGKGPLGFIAPLLYTTLAKNPTAIRDIVRGSDPNCGQKGFTAGKSYDVVSGVGAPIVDQLLKIVMALP